MGRRRRCHAPTPRRRVVRLRLTDEEFDAVSAAAVAEGSAVAAWVGVVAVRAASSGPDVPADWRDVLKQLVRARQGQASDELLQRIDLLIVEAARRARRS